MKLFKVFFISAAILLVVVSACSNNTTPPANADPAASAPVAAPQTAQTGLVFTGKTTDGSSVVIEFFDNYLEKVLDGNPYDNGLGTPPTSGISVLMAEVKISTVDYYGRPLEVDCPKTLSLGFVLIIKGYLANGNTASYALSTTDNVYYVCDSSANPGCIPNVVQGSKDTITSIEFIDILNSIVYEPEFVCNGSDNNQYFAKFHGLYDYNYMDKKTIFDVANRTIDGVVSFKIKNYDDDYVSLFLK